MATGPVNLVIRQMRRIALSHDNGYISDGWLLDAFLKAKDEAAFEALVKRHGPMVLGVCRRLLRNTHDAENAFQATFVVLLRKAHAIRNRDLLGNWLYGVACRTAMKARANAARRKAKERQVNDMRSASWSAEQTSEELLALLDVELHRLPDKLRAPLVLCDLQGMARKQAARKLGWPIGSLNWRLARARSILAKKLKQHGVTLGTGTLAACLARHAAAASVPAPLLDLTVKTAVIMSIGNNAAAGVVSAKVASLAEGVVRMMFLTKLKIAAGLVLLVGVLGTCVGQRSSQTLAAESHYEAFSLVTEDPAKEEPSAPLGRRAGDMSNRETAVIRFDQTQRCPVHREALFVWVLGAERLCVRAAHTLYIRARAHIVCPSRARSVAE
jgi:RNA polymerase sigma factor (sigma-70 family)